MFSAADDLRIAARGQRFGTILADPPWQFSRGKRPGWAVWGNQADESYKPDWPTYNYNSALEIAAE